MGAPPRLYWQGDTALGNAEIDYTLNYAPFVDIDFGAGLPFYSISTNHLLSFSMENNVAILQFCDPTNFIFERLLKYAFAKNKNKGILLRWGWTNGPDKITQPDNIWTTLMVSNLTSSLGIDGTQWTIVLQNFLTYSKDILKFSAAIQISQLTTLDDLQSVVNELVGGKPKIVFHSEVSLKDEPNFASAGEYATDGDVTLGEFLSEIVSKRWISETSGIPPRIAVSNAIARDQSIEPQINVMLYDIKDALDSKAAVNQSISSFDPDTFKNCTFVLRYPVNESGTMDLAFGQDLKWSDLVQARNLYVDSSGNTIVTTSESEIPEKIVAQVKERLGQNAITTTSADGLGRTNEIADNAATAVGIAKVMETLRYQSLKIILRLRGEPELFDYATLIGYRIGLIINIVPFMDTTVLSYGDDNESFQRAFPMFAGPNEDTFRILKEVFQQNDENFYSQFTGVWIVKGLKQNITAGSYITELELSRSPFD